MHVISKYILNHLLHNGTLKQSQTNELINKVAEKHNLQPKNHKQITEINDHITKHLFRIDLRTCEITGDKIYTIVNQTIDDLASAAQSNVDFEYLEVIFNEVMLSGAKYISSILALNLTNKLRGNISKDNAQLRLEAWFQNGYLVLDKGQVFLGPRAISEFEEYFKGQYNERMTKCGLCTDYVYFGKICSSCNEVLHKHCAEKQLNRNNCCPLCKKDWIEAQERNYDIASSESENEMDTD